MSWAQTQGANVYQVAGILRFRATEDLAAYIGIEPQHEESTRLLGEAAEGFRLAGGTFEEEDE